MPESLHLNPRPTVYRATIGRSMGLFFNHLQRLPAPFPVPPRHNYGTANLSSTHSRHSGLRIGYRLMPLLNSPGNILPRILFQVWKGAYG